jgi:cytochrome c oxidase subunit 1
LEELASARFKPVIQLPKLFVATGVAWLWAGGILGLLMLYQQYSGGKVADYYSLMTGHGVIMAFAGLFQLMVGLSLLRGGLCYGKPTGGLLAYLTYLVLNSGSLLLVAASLAGVRISYTLMFPLPAVGAFKGLWGLDLLTVAVLGIVLLLVAIIVLYPAQLVKLLFFGKTNDKLQLEKRRFYGILDPSMMGMAAYAFLLPPLGSPILIAALAILGMLFGVLTPQSISFMIDAVNFNYMLWVFAHNLMEAMGIMALATIYFIVPLYTADGKIELYSWKAARLAVMFYTTAATVAFFHHMYTMVSTQPLGLSYLGQVASWLRE